MPPADAADTTNGGRVLVVIPTYQEGENIEDVVTRVRRAVPEAHVLVVDDHSPDGTADIAERVGAATGSVDVLRRARKGGIGAAYRAGFAWGLDRGYDVLVEMDADLSHEPEALPVLLGAITSRGADLVIGSRYVPGGSIPTWSWHRRALSRWGNRYSSLALAIGTTDATSGYRAYRADVLRDVAFETASATGYAFQIELAYRVARAGGSIAEVPIVFADRTRGRSKMSPWIAGEALVLVTWWCVRDRLLRLERRTGRGTTDGSRTLRAR